MHIEREDESGWKEEEEGWVGGWVVGRWAKWFEGG